MVGPLMSFRRWSFHHQKDKDAGGTVKSQNTVI